MGLPVKRAAYLWGIIVLLLGGSPCGAQTTGNFEADRLTASRLFHAGKLRDSAAAIVKLLPSAPNVATRLGMQRDLLEVCTASYDIRCVNDTIEAMLPPMAADRSLGNMYPEIVLYELTANIWLQNDEYVRETLQRGGASSIANIGSDPATHAEVQLALHSYYVRRNELAAAEQSIAGAIMGLLLSNPDASYKTSKILIRLIGALISGNDATGAFQLFKETESFINSATNKESSLYAEHLANAGRLFAFTKLNGVTASILGGVDKIY